MMEAAGFGPSSAPRKSRRGTSLAEQQERIEALTVGRCCGGGWGVSFKPGIPNKDAGRGVVPGGGRMFWCSTDGGFLLGGVG